MTEVIYTFSGETLAAFVKGKLRTIPNSHPGYDELVAYLESTTDHDEDRVMEMVDMKTMISRLTAGKVKVVGNTVYYNGGPVHSALTQKLLDVLNAGAPADAWANFLNNIMKNPNPRSRECLYNFLAHNDTPLTEDGCFVAWKYVDQNLCSMHADPDGNHLDHTPGLTVEMDRDQVDSNPNVTCSTGLHCCGSPYMGGYTTGRRTVKVKVHPRDVCAVPNDYRFQKMRVCRYYVLEEVGSQAEIDKVDKEVVTRDVSGMEGVIPNAIKDLPVCETAADFNVMWSRTDYDVEEGSLVARKGRFMIGMVMSCEEDTEWEEEFDEDGEIEEIEGSTYWTYSVVWQNGIYEEIIIYDYEHEVLSRVERIEVTEEVDTTDIPEQDMATFVIEEHKGGAGGVTAQTFHHGDKTYTPRQLLSGIEKAGSQRAYCRETGLKRSTLQGWLSKIDHDQLDRDIADGAVVFKHANSGTEIEANALVAMVQKDGQRAVGRMLGVPRSTLQGWLASV